MQKRAFIHIIVIGFIDSYIQCYFIDIRGKGPWPGQVSYSTQFPFKIGMLPISFAIMEAMVTCLP